MKKLFSVLFLMLFSMAVFAQETERSAYTRGSGMVVRPELYSGLFAELGYQINPYVQVGGGFGFGIDEMGGTCFMAGIRAYTSDSRFAGMFDYHVGALSLQGYNFIRHTIVGGISYKDFDIGAGVLYLTDLYDGGIGFSITLGYNFRCYKHR